ncbi:hypothetical protein Tco_0499356 [Tanacetum coccineum]
MTYPLFWIWRIGCDPFYTAYSPPIRRILVNNIHTTYSICLIRNLAPLPHRDLRNPWLRYQVDRYDEGIIHSYEQRLQMIWGRLVNRVYVLDFAGLTDGMRQTLGDRLSMVYAGDDGQALFTSHAWRRLFGVRAPLVREFILEFFSTCRMSDTEIGIDVTDTLCLHSEDEMAEAGFGAYWSGSERVIPDKGDLRDYWMEISSDKDFLGTAPSYVHIRDHSGARLSGGHFIGRLAAHFGLVGDQGLRGLSVVVSELLVIDLHKLDRLNICSRFGDTWAWVALRP